MAFTDSISLGPAPAEEDPVQLGDDDYAPRARRECRRYIEAIRKACGDEPEGAQLRVVSCPHDFGNYLDVEVRFDGNNEAASEYAYRCEEKAPTTWEQAGMHEKTYSIIPHADGRDRDRPPG